MSAFERIALDLSPQLYIIWTGIRLTDVRVVSVDQDHAFPDNHLLQLGIRFGYLTAVSRIPWARVVCCVARHEGWDSSIIDSVSSNDSGESFLGFYIGYYSIFLYIYYKITLQINSRMVIFWLFCQRNSKTKIFLIWNSKIIMSSSVWDHHYNTILSTYKQLKSS